MTGAGSRPGGRRWVVVLAVAVSLGVLAVRVGWYHRAGLVPGLVVDDAYISFRFARNLVRGEGLVFNPGERVEGYTNFLWTALVAGAMATGADPEPATEVLAGLAAVGTVLLLAALARRLLRGPRAAAAAAGRVLAIATIAGLAAHAQAEPWPRHSGRLGGLVSIHRTLHALGAWLRSDSPSGAVIAAPGVGVIPYVTDWPTVDMFGLVDEHIAHGTRFDPAMPPAHAKTDPGYVMRRKPDYLISDLTPQGVPYSANLGYVADRIASDYELVAQAKKSRGRLVRGRRVMEVHGFRPRLYQGGYKMGIFRRLGAPSEREAWRRAHRAR